MEEPLPQSPDQQYAELLTESEQFDKKTLDQFLDLHQMTLEALQIAIQYRNTANAMEARLQLKSTLLTELMFAEPAIRQSKFWSDVEIGTAQFEDAVDQQYFTFTGLGSVMEHRDGIPVKVQEDPPGDAPSGNITLTVKPIPLNILISAARQLQEWMSEAGLYPEFGEGDADEWEI